GQRVSTWSLEWLIDERVARQGVRRFLKWAIYTPAWYWLWRPWYFGLDLLGLGSSITYTCVTEIPATCRAACGWGADGGAS
ncbi:MAG: hypothetical protein JXM73_05375, partial [Anaerolineae bacterium]|nr:hypothetical protein [Anaerolineae bacterium]